MPSLVITTKFKFSGVFIIDALGPDDMQTGKRLFDDLLHLKNSGGEPLARYREVRDTEALYETLAQIDQMCFEGYRPVIHFEGHGDKDSGLLVGTSGQRISWPDLGARIAKLNATTRNNIGVVLATCYGLYQFDAVDILQPCPFTFLVAPSSVVESGYIMDRMPKIYRTLLATRSIDKAFGHLDSRFIKIHAESFFCNAFADYLRSSCFGKGGEARREHLLSRAISDGVAKNRETRRIFRTFIRRRIRDQEADFYRMSRRFLHGKRTVTYQEVLAHARGDA